jgi:4'-phosphopantetheinyl transferase EntD
MNNTPLFPPQVSMVAATEEMWETPVLKAEEQLISGASNKRQREFRAGRHCAHAALERLGLPRQAVLRDDHRAPIWPPGYLGSISHCRDLCIAACAALNPLFGLGLDVEPLEPLKPGVAGYIHTPEETAYLETLSPRLPERLLFSAKESLYKCFYPLLKVFIGFKAVRIELDIEKQRFDFRPTPQSKVRFPEDKVFWGRYLITDTHLITGCYLTTETGPRPDMKAAPYAQLLHD